MCPLEARETTQKSHQSMLGQRVPSTMKKYDKQEHNSIFFMIFGDNHSWWFDPALIGGHLDIPSIEMVFRLFSYG
jgi:hypothetical protein